MREEVQEVRSQLETEKTRGEEIWEELTDTKQALAEVQSENSELRSQLEQERADREQVEAEFAELKQKSVAARELPEAADLLNQLRERLGQKCKAGLADVATLLDILEGEG